MSISKHGFVDSIKLEYAEINFFAYHENIESNFVRVALKRPFND